jgi:hypothetical protein
MKLPITFILLLLTGAARADFAPKFELVDGTPVLSIADLEATADGTRPFAFQWYRNGVLLPGETHEMIIIKDPRETGAFHCVISNKAGSAKTGTVKFANTTVETAPDILITRKQPKTP